MRFFTIRCYEHIRVTEETGVIENVKDRNPDILCHTKTPLRKIDATNLTSPPGDH